MSRRDFNDIRTSYAYISGIARHYAVRPLLTLQQAERVSALLNRITDDVCPKGMVWGYDGGQGMTLGILNDRGQFSPVSGSHLSKSQYSRLLSRICQERSCLQPVSYRFEKKPGVLLPHAIAGNILIDPRVIIANRRWENLGKNSLAEKIPAKVLKGWRIATQLLARVGSTMPVAERLLRSRLDTSLYSRLDRT